jgi:uncharacterized protein
MLPAGGALAFDCAAAKSKVEKTICADPGAKAADDAMSAAFSTLRPTLEAAGSKALLANQRAWLKGRDEACLAPDLKGTMAACLQDQDKARVRVLAATPDAGPGVPGRLVPVFVERPAAKRAYQVSVQLYRFAKAATPAETAFNAAVDKMLAAIPTQVEDARDGMSYSYERKATLTFGSDRLLSMAVTGWEFSGGAHGNSIASTLNLDLRGGRMFTDDDLMAPAQRAEVTKLCVTQVGDDLKSRLKDSGDDPDKDAESKKSFAGTLTDMETGIADTVKGIDNWSFGASAATVTFVQDSTAAHVYGGFSCEVPYATLKPLVKPGFPLP